MTKSFIGKFLNSITEEQWKQIETNNTKWLNSVLKVDRLFLQNIQEIINARKNS